MKFLRTTDPRFHLVDLKVGVFLLTSLIGSMLVLGYIGWRWELFTPAVSFHLEPVSGQGIMTGMTVKHRGFRVGKVSEVALDPDGRVQVQLRVINKYANLVRNDTVARLMSETMIGDSIIDLSAGSPEAGPAAPGCTLAFAREQTISEVTEKLRAEITPALAELRSLLAYVNDPNGDIRSLIVNLQSASTSFSEHMPGTLAAMQESAIHSHEFFDYAVDPGGDLKLTLRSLQGIAENLNREVPPIIDKTSLSIGRLEKTSATLQKAIERTAPRIPQVAEQTTRAMEGVTEVTDTLSGLWPLQPQLKKKREEPLTIHGVR